uniref:Uncharacterized protein n=1 Tax=Avena sativa TaxID=4498 RepID=A0ACD5Y3D8_AVESA
MLKGAGCSVICIANGASMFLILVHLHIFRGLYHASYSSPREFVRCLRVVIFLLMIVTAFIGYVPPWEMYVRSSSFRPIHQGIFWLLLADCLLLGWIGCQPVEAPFVTIGQIPSVFFFLFFAITPIPGRVGRGIPKYYTDETHHTGSVS